MKTSAHGTALIETDTYVVAVGCAGVILGVAEVVSPLDSEAPGGVCLQDRTANITIIMMKTTIITTARSVKLRLVRSYSPLLN